MQEHEELKIIEMKSSKLGCYNEKVAICYLMKKGLEVFDSAQTHGAVDLMTFNPLTGETKCWEVKSENYRKANGWRIARSRHKKEWRRKIHMIYVDKDQTCREGVMRK